MEDPENAPLRRFLGRQAWLRNPVVALRYERDRDRVMLQLVDTPSTAVGAINAGQNPSRGGDLFIGFDGNDANAWPTTIALLGFGRHYDQDTTQLAIVRALVGSEVWAAAVSLLRTPGVHRTVPISRDEAWRLIRRWSGMIVPFDETSLSDEAIIEALDEWSASPTQRVSVPSAGASAPTTTEGRPWLPAAAFLGAADKVSRSPAHGRNPVEDNRGAGRHVDGPRPSAGGVAMARRLPSPGEDIGPSKPVKYGLLARLSDRWAARRDGGAGVPPIRPDADPADGRHGLTPYLEIRNRHFLDWAERERRRMLTDLDDTYRARAEIRQQIVGADERAAGFHKLFENMPADPPDPARRNAIEQHAPEELIRARRRREFEAERSRLGALEHQAAESAREFRVQEARLSETIAARERVLDSRVRQLHAHSLRRCGTYKRHIVHHHPDGSAVIPHLDLALPALPDWMQNLSSDSGQANAP